MAAIASAPSTAPRAGRRASWLPLLVFGVLLTLSLPLSDLASSSMPGGILIASPPYPTVLQAMYSGAGLFAGPQVLWHGWYWVGVLLAGPLLITAGYRWRDRRDGHGTPLRGYLVTGVGLAVVTAALPLLGWDLPSQSATGFATPAMDWMSAMWASGVFALLAIAVNLVMLARLGRSRALAVSTAVFLATVVLAGWNEVQTGPAGAYLYGLEDPGLLLPAAILVLAGLGSLVAFGVRRPRAASQL